MLQIADKTAIAGVIASVAARLGKQERAVARRTKVAQKATREIARAQAKLEAALDTILDRIEQGFSNVMALYAEPEMSRFLETLWSDKERTFTLYQVANSDVVTVELRPGHLLVNVKGERISSVQTAGGMVRYHDCELGAEFSSDNTYRASRAFFWSLFLNPLTGDFWEDSDYRSTELQLFVGRDFKNRRRKVTAAQLERFDSFTSLTLQKKTDEHLYSLRGYSDDPDVGYWRQWSEMGVDVNHILSRFFYDCADPEVLGKHLSAAIQNINA